MDEKIPQPKPPKPVEQMSDEELALEFYKQHKLLIQTQTNLNIIDAELQKRLKGKPNGR